MDEIWDHIASELQNLSAAKRTVNRIMDAVDQLSNFAEIGTPLSSVAGVGRGYRYILSDNYMVFYRVMGNDVYIDRILYSRRDYLRILLESQN